LNEFQIELSKGSLIILSGDMGLRVGDNDNKRFYPFTKKYVGTTGHEINLQKIINQILNHAPSGLTPSPISIIRFNFSRAINETSFSPSEDIVSFPDRTAT